MWTVEQYLVRPSAVLRCTLCGVERIGNYKQANQGKLRCWTCTPPPQRTKAPRQPSPPTQPPVAPEAAPPAPEVKVRRFAPGKQPKAPPPPPKPKHAPLAGRLDSGNENSYSRVVRYQIETDDAGIEHGRIEIAGFRARNPMNKRLTWQAVNGIVMGAKRTTMEALELCLERPHESHSHSYDVRLYRVSSKDWMDDDGIASALKAVRDTFAIFVHINDGNRRRIRFHYASGKGRVQGLVIEWTRTDEAFEHEEPAGYIFFDDEEIAILAKEHAVTRRHWKERMAKRLLSRAEREVGPGDDEQAEEAAYDQAEE